MGGGFAVALAAGHGFEASSVNYGTLPANAEDLLGNACPIVASYGARDRSVGDAPARLRQILDGNGIDNDVKVYPGAGLSAAEAVDRLGSVAVHRPGHPCVRLRRPLAASCGPVHRR